MPVRTFRYASSALPGYSGGTGYWSVACIVRAPSMSLDVAVRIRAKSRGAAGPARRCGYPDRAGLSRCFAKEPARHPLPSEAHEVRPCSSSVRSSCSRPSPTRPSSPSRTRGCSRRSRRARESCRSRWNTRPRPARCSTSSAARQLELQPVLDTIVETPASCARPKMRSLQLKDGDGYHAGRAQSAPPDSFVEYSAELDRLHRSEARRRPRGARATHGACPRRRSADPRISATCATPASLAHRTMLAVPLLREGEPSASSRRTHGRAAVHRQADRAGQDLRRPGRDRHREHAAVRGGAGAHERADRGAGAADGDLARS